MLCERGGDTTSSKLLDFGIVKRIEAAAADTDANRILTRQMRLLGTPAYMAPERIGLRRTSTRARMSTAWACCLFPDRRARAVPGTDQAAILRDVIAPPRRDSRMPSEHSARSTTSSRAVSTRRRWHGRAPSATSRRCFPVTAPATVDARAGARSWWETWREGQWPAAAAAPASRSPNQWLLLAGRGHRSESAERPLSRLHVAANDARKAAVMARRAAGRRLGSDGRERPFPGRSSASQTGRSTAINPPH